MKRRGGDSPSAFAEEQAKWAAEQIDLLANLGESLFESLQGVKQSGSMVVWRRDRCSKLWLF